MVHLLPTPAGHLVERCTGVLEPAVVVPENVAGLIGHPRELGNRIGHRVEALFAFPKRPCTVLDALFEIPGECLQLGHQAIPLFLRACSLGRVHDRRKHEAAFSGLDWIQTNLDGHLGAVLPHPEQFATRTHGAHARMIVEFFPQLGASPKTRGHQLVDRLADQLAPLVTEHLFYLPIHKHDSASGIRHDHTGGRCLDGEAELIIGPVALCYCVGQLPLSRGQVRNNLDAAQLGLLKRCRDSPRHERKCTHAANDEQGNTKRRVIKSGALPEQAQPPERHRQKHDRRHQSPNENASHRLARQQRHHAFGRTSSQIGCGGSQKADRRVQRDGCIVPHPVQCAHTEDIAAQSDES